MATFALHELQRIPRTLIEINKHMVQETKIMKLRTLALAATAVSLATAPVAAEITSQRAAPASDASEIGGSGSGIVLALLAAAAVVGGIVIAADGDDDDVLSA